MFDRVGASSLFPFESLQPGSLSLLSSRIGRSPSSTWRDRSKDRIGSDRISRDRFSFSSSGFTWACGVKARPGLCPPPPCLILRAQQQYTALACCKSRASMRRLSMLAVAPPGVRSQISSGSDRTGTAGHQLVRERGWKSTRTMGYGSARRGACLLPEGAASLFTDSCSVFLGFCVRNKVNLQLGYFFK